MTSLDDLPQEVLEKVLTFSQDYSARSAPAVDGAGNLGIVEEFHGLQDLIPVSPKWRFLIENKIGISLVLGNNEENGEEADISRITEIGVAKCQILPTYIKPLHLLIPQFKYPSLLRTLKIYNGFLSQPEFRNLLDGTRNLHTLTLSSRTYSNLNVSNVQPVELPNLRRLTLGKRREESSLPFLGFLGMGYLQPNTGSGLTEILRIFAASSVPRLSKLKLSASALYIWDVALLTKDFLSFLVHHAQSLRDLDVSFLNVDECQHLVRNEGRTMVLAETEVLLSQLPELRLNTFKVELLTYKESIKWARFIDACEKVANMVTGLSLRRMLYAFYRETSYYGHFIQNNQATITLLTLNVSNFNCALLAQCVNLEVLVLYGKKKTVEEYETDKFRGVPAKPEVENLALLPKSLGGIRISDLFVASPEIAILNFGNFPKLSYLSAFHIGEKENLGMTSKDLSSLVGTISGDKERVFWLRIIRGINCRPGQEPADPTLSQAHPLPSKDRGSEMFVNLAFQGGFRARREGAAAAPVIQNGFELKQNWG